MSKKEMSYKTSTSLKQAVNYLENLVESLKSGVVNLEIDGQSLSLEMAERIDFELSAGTKKDRRELVFELSWRQAELTPPSLGGLKIFPITPAGVFAKEAEPVPASEAGSKAEPEPMPEPVTEPKAAALKDEPASDETAAGKEEKAPQKKKDKKAAKDKGESKIKPKAAKPRELQAKKK